MKNEHLDNKVAFVIGAGVLGALFGLAAVCVYFSRGDDIYLASNSTNSSAIKDHAQASYSMDLFRLWLIVGTTTAACVSMGLAGCLFEKCCGRVSESKVARKNCYPLLSHVRIN